MAKRYTPNYASKDGSFYLGFLDNFADDNPNLCTEKYTGKGDKSMFAKNPVVMPENLSGETKKESPTHADCLNLIQAMYGVTKADAEKIANLELWGRLRSILTQSVTLFYGDPGAAFVGQVMSAFERGDMETFSRLAAKKAEYELKKLTPTDEDVVTEDNEA